MPPYIPKDSINFKDQEVPQVRLLLVGPPGCGKTFNVVSTFPNIVYPDFDRGLTDTRLKAFNPIILPFYDTEWCKATLGTKDQCLAYKKWLNTEARLLTPEQTLFTDSITGLQAAIHIYYEGQSPISPKTGEVDGFYLWKQKEGYLRDIHNIFKSLKCHIVCAMHSKEERNKDDVLIGKTTPYMTGGFKEQLCSHYTDVFRAYSTPNTKEKPAQYLWQVWADANHDYVKTRGSYPTSFIPAGFQNISHK